MNKNYLANTIFTVMVMLTSSTFWLLGENRVDVYFSMYTLEYFVVKALFNPRRLYKDFLAFVLIAIFAVIVGYRVYEVLI
ncbi:MAG: hypothetical protein ACP5LN_09645 [Thermoproteota archaeon]